MRNRVFENIEWRTPESLCELNFLPADRELIQLLADGKVDSNSKTGSGFSVLICNFNRLLDHRAWIFPSRSSSCSVPA